MRATVYADNAATTQLDKEAFDAMVPWLLDEYGNASQPYSFARKPKKALAGISLSKGNKEEDIQTMIIALSKILR